MSETAYEALRLLPIQEIRASIRSGEYQGHTAGFAPGNLQANLVVLGKDYAKDFHQFCLKNPQPCPLVGVSEPGNPRLPNLGDIDIRSDIPSYNLYRHGRLEESLSDISELWADDMMAFALGCSFTFERALEMAGIRLKHIEQNRTVPMFATNIELAAVGPFSGGMVVSMRPIPKDQVDLAVNVTAQFPHAHGAPVHIGNFSEIGIEDLSKPDWGQSIAVDEGEVPVFWACGVTPQNVLAKAAPDLCITHTPGRMLVTDLSDEDYQRLVAA